MVSLLLILLLCLLLFSSLPSINILELVRRRIDGDHSNNNQVTLLLSLIKLGTVRAG